MRAWPIIYGHAPGASSSAGASDRTPRRFVGEAMIETAPQPNAHALEHAENSTDDLADNLPTELSTMHD